LLGDMDRISERAQTLSADTENVSVKTMT